MSSKAPPGVTLVTPLIQKAECAPRCRTVWRSPLNCLDAQARSGSLSWMPRENALQRSERNRTMAEPDYKILFEGLPGLYLVLDPTLRVVAASDAYLNATLTKRDDILGQCLLDAFPAPRDPDDPRAQAVRDTLASLDRVLAHRVPDSIMVQRHERRPGSEGGGPVVRHWSQSNSPILNPDGSVAYIVHRLEDVSGFIPPEPGGERGGPPRKWHVAAMRGMDAGQIDSRLLANVSHELRTSLTLILGPLERLLASDGIDEELRKALAGIHRNARTLQRLVGDLVDVATPGGGTGQPADEAPVMPSADAADIPVPRDVAAPHVLVVEDHPEMNLFLARELGRHYWVSRAFSVDEAVRKALLPDQPDLILASVAMPGMSGAAMVDEFRRHGRLAEIPIMMLTTKMDDTLRLELLRRGVHEFLPRPFPVEELLLRVQGLLTERRRVERLRQSEERYRTLFNSIDEGFCIVRMIFDESDKAIDYRFIETNASFEHQTGLFDVQGRRMRELAPDIEDEWFETYGRVALTGEPSRFDIRSDLLQRWFNAFAFRYGPPELRQVAILFKDITARKQNEEAMREADRRKDQFLALLAHELRNPLAPIRNSVHILQMSAVAQTVPARQLLPMMERQLAHIARLLDDLLDVSRIAIGKIELRREQVDLAQAIQAAVEANKPLIESMGHQLTVSLPPHPVTFEADPVRLTQVVSNLLNNAANHSPAGGRITLAVHIEARELRLSVKDTGVGIEQKDLDKVFGLFVQVGSPFARPQGGLGIGLSLVRTLVEMHGGRVQAVSEGPGKGSEFIVRLPLPADRARPGPRPLTPAGSGA